jgi:S-adenosylmethionine synthetase
MTLEAAAGKNPVSHVGKLYQLAAQRMAGAVAEEIEGVEDAACILVSQIGRPVDDPEVVDLAIAGAGGAGAHAGAEARAIVRREIGRLAQVRDDVLSGRAGVF